MTATAPATVYDDFATADGWPGHARAGDSRPGDKWYRHLPVPGLWDPAATVTVGGGTLAIAAPAFTLTRPDGHDNVKALIYSTADFCAGERGLLTVATEMRVETSATAGNPHGVEAGDVRLGCGAFNTIDTKTWMVFDFFVSGSRIAALYERLPFGQGPDDPYPAFTELIPIAVPTAQGQWHRYAIIYDRTNDRAKWQVDGAVVAVRHAVGAPPRQPAPIVKINALKIGGGLFTLYGDLHNDRARAGDGVMIPGLDPHYRRTLFGQGARVEFRAFTVAQT